MKSKFGRSLVILGVTVHLLWLLTGVYLAGRATILITLGVGFLFCLGLWFRMKRRHPPIKSVGHNPVQRFVLWYQEGLRQDELAGTLLILGLSVGWAVLSFLVVLGSYDQHLIAPLKTVDPNAAGLRTLWLTLAGIVVPATLVFGGHFLSR